MKLPCVELLSSFAFNIDSRHYTQVQRLLRRLPEVPAVLTNRRRNDHTRISCGGTGAVAFRTWGAFFHAAENLTAALPDADPPLPHVAEFVQRHCRHRGACDFAGHMPTNPQAGAYTRLLFSLT